MHVCHHNSIGITTSMLSCVPLSISIVQRVWYFECFAFPNQCLKLQFYGGGNAIRGKKVCTIVNAVNLLTAYVTYTGHTHKYADCRRTANNVSFSHCSPEVFKYYTITYAEYLAASGQLDLNSTRANSLLFVCSFLHSFLYGPFLPSVFISPLRFLLLFFALFQSTLLMTFNIASVSSSYVCVRSPFVCRFLH